MRGGNYYSRGGGNNNNNSNAQRGGGGGAGGIHHNKGSTHSTDDRDQKEKKKRDAIFDLKKFTDKRIRVKFMGGREDPENPDSVEDERKRHVGLVVLRGPSIILVSPTDGSEEIENPFVQAE
ncbi:hypothetical protein IW150_003515 [Coemansia sp. RSA 2607]|nr:hypothetical protein IW150_003515 [Coemansia sp. RSA 2607]